MKIIFQLGANEYFSPCKIKAAEIILFKITMEFIMKKLSTQTMVQQLKWQRVILLTVLGYEAAGAVLGGILLIAAPNGRFMDMPVDIMHGAFPDFVIPGIILLALGILNGIAFISVLHKSHNDWCLAGLALGGLLIWFVVEIIILQELHWLHAMWGIPVLRLGANHPIDCLAKCDSEDAKSFTYLWDTFFALVCCRKYLCS